MDSEPRRIGRFLWRTFVRDADMTDRIAEIVGGIGALVVGHALAWSWTIAILAATGAFVLGRRAYFLSEPYIELRFADSPKFITNGPIRLMHVEAINRSAETAQNCCAFLLGVKRQGPNGASLDTQFTQAIKLKWQPDEGATISMHSQIHYDFNVLTARNHPSQLVLERAAGPALPSNVFTDPGSVFA
jgi:hypothetical protein